MKYLYLVATILIFAMSASFYYDVLNTSPSDIKSQQTANESDKKSNQLYIHPTHKIETQVLGVKTDNYYDLLSRYDWNPDTMYRIMKCESGFNPRAHNPEWHNGCRGSYGLLQVACVHGFNNLYDPEANIEAAYRVWQKQGYWAWKNCYKKTR